ncbi:MAG: hypothetical protein AABO58_09120, partial [Acidobacteriota bacterium]
MIRHRSTLAFSLALAALALTLPAQQHPNTSRGFDLGKTYQMNGLDNINLFNGNLTVTIPIGQRYRVNGNLEYGLTLVYSGNVWDEPMDEQMSCGWRKRTYPNRRSNAGIGWLLSMGRLFPPNQDPLPGSDFWNYESPDGALHAFHPRLHDAQASTDPDRSYTRDGSYLRMTEGLNDRTVEFPDGTKQVFKQLNRVANGLWPPGTEVWRLTAISDRFGNSVTIDYSSALAAPPNPAYPEIWTLSDGLRSQKVYFIAAVSPYSILLDHIDLSAFNTATATWRMTYDQEVMTPGLFDDSNSSCNNFTGTWNVPLLTEVTLPLANGVSQVYSMALSGSPYYSIDANLTFVHALNGHLKGIQLPTKGWLEWDYLNYPFYAGSEERFRRSVVVKERRMMAADRAPANTSKWTYGRVASGVMSCVDQFQVPYSARPEQLVVSVTSPEQVTSVHYFSTWEATTNPCIIPETSFKDDEYALPFSRAESKVVGGVTRYLSQETYTGTPPSLATGPDEPRTDKYRVNGGTRVRSEWVAYESDTDWEAVREINSREKTRLIYHGDDRADCGGTCEYESVTRYRFDDFGHYRQSSTSGNFPAANHRTTLINYPTRTLTDTWLLNTYPERCTVDDGANERTTELAQCTGTAGPPANVTVASRFCFNATTGFLERTRTLNGGSGSSSISAAMNDVIVAFTKNAAGNVTREDYYGGGNDASTTTDDACAATLPSSPAYSIEHTYAFGSREKSRYLYQPGQINPNFYSLNNVIDASTGLVKESKDVTGQSTSYLYDVLGRLTDVTPPTGLAATSISYTEATTTARAKATVTTTSASAGQQRATTIFDDFGRPVREEKLLPGTITSARETVYTPSGWTEKVSEWETTPAHFTVFSSFDAFGRPKVVTTPDNKTTNIAYVGGSKVTRTVSFGGIGGAASAVTTETYDRQKRLQKIEEPGTNSTTTYTYDPADRLTGVSMVADNTTQPRTFVYDKRGFLTSEQHPESGLTSYDGYDARGHAGRKLVGATNSDFDLKYEYDAAERLTKIHQILTRSPETARLAKQFTFGTATDTTNYTQGRLTEALRHNYQPAGGGGDVTVKEQYKYFNHGGVKEKTTEIKAGTVLLQNFRQSYSYNDLGLMSTLTYPTCIDP